MAEGVLSLDRAGRVVDYVFEMASVKDKEVSKDALQKAVEKLEEE